MRKTSKADYCRSIWKLARPYWTSRDRWKACALLIGILAMILAGVYLTTYFIHIKKSGYDALQKLDAPAYTRYLELFIFYVLGCILTDAARAYLVMRLQIRWRRWMNREVLQGWLKNRAYYFSSLQQSVQDNPDQRISDDVHEFVNMSLDLTLNLFGKIISFFTFTAVLWELSGDFQFSVANHSINIPGYMVWICFFYCAFGTWLAHIIGRPLVRLSYDQQRYEANYRFDLVRVRENSENIASLHGENSEYNHLRARFQKIYSNYIGVAIREIKINGYGSFFNSSQDLMPLALMAPRLFSGKITLGVFLQTAVTFSQVIAAFSFIIPAYKQIARWRSIADRLIEFQDEIEKAKIKSDLVKGSFSHDKNLVGELRLQNLSITLPNGENLFHDLNLQISKGNHLLISGPTGIGKSSLFRAIAGIWPYFGGSIKVPDGYNPMLLPQKPYLPIDTLAATLTYPRAPAHFPMPHLQKIMSLCGLSYLIEYLDIEENWAIKLSPGEQQRIGFARLLLHKPDWIFLDESTSALDEKSEQNLYRLIFEELPKSTIVSIGHRNTLWDLHQQHLDLATHSDRKRVA